MKIVVHVLAACINLTTLDCHSQYAHESIKSAERPRINKPMPAFTLKDVHHGDSTFRLSMDDFRGKWLFLDFWYRGCVSCIKSFPKINALQARFRDSVRFVLVGVNSKMNFGDGIKVMYENLSQKQGLSLTIAYDSLLSQQWDIYSFPHIIIIDPNGIVRTITAGLELTETKLHALMKGDSTAIERKDLHQPAFPPDQIPVFGEKMLHVSAIAPWNGEGYVIPVLLDYNQNRNRAKNQDLFENRQSDRIVVSMLSLGDMFRLAFIGKWQWLNTDSLYSEYYPFPILETHRKDLFEYSHKEGTGFYNYYLQTPAPATPSSIMNLMQHELQSTFGFEAKIEKRFVPVWKLVAQPGAGKRLRSKGNAPIKKKNNDGDGGVAGFELHNLPVSALLQKITRYISDNEPPFFDCTGIEHNIDIKIDALMTDKKQIMNALQQYGLSLIKEDKEMSTLVVRDARK